MATPPTDLFKRLARTGARLNAEPAGWDRGVLLRFWRVEDGAMVLKLESALREDQQLARGLPFWAVFENMGRVRTFTSEIVEVVHKPDGTVAGLRCRLPDEVKSEDRRRAFRVPKVPPFAVRATLHSGEQTWPTRVVNLSVLGVLLEFPEPVAAALSEEAPYKLVLETFEGNATVGAIMVRRSRRGRLAFRFPASTKMGEVSPSPELARVVRFAELVWMRRRNGKDGQGSKGGAAA